MQRQQRTIIRGQLDENSDDLIGSGACRGIELRIRRISHKRGLVTGRHPMPAGGGSSPAEIASDINCDPPKPVQKWLLRPPSRQGLDHPQEHLLSAIFQIRALSDETPEQATDFRLMSYDEHGQSVTISNLILPD